MIKKGGYGLSYPPLCPRTYDYSSGIPLSSDIQTTFFLR